MSNRPRPRALTLLEVVLIHCLKSKDPSRLLVILHNNSNSMDLLAFSLMKRYLNMAIVGKEVSPSKLSKVWTVPGQWHLLLSLRRPPRGRLQQCVRHVLY